MKKPERHILVAVLGQTPQIITETLYVLRIQRRIPISEVFVITTRTGAERAQRDLLDPQSGQFFAFCREYRIPPSEIAFDAEHILTITKVTASRRNQKTKDASSDSGRDVQLEDIRTVEDNRHLAEQLLGMIRKLSDDPEAVLHGSIAGGRKTMSAYMLLAFTLYGREQDRLYHVLVPEPFENNPQFFFPPRREQLIGIGVGQVVSTREARIDLAEIPFVRLRPWLGKKARQLDQTVEEQIRVVQYKLNRQSEQREPLTIHYRMKEARLGERTLPLTGVQLALFAYFAERRAKHAHHREGKADRRRCPDCFQSFAEVDQERYGALYEQFARSRATAEERREKLRQKGKELLDHDLFLSYCSKINRALKNEGFPAEIQIENIAATPRNARYGLRLDPARIEVVMD